jgi:hypothetical protein
LTFKSSHLLVAGNITAGKIYLLWILFFGKNKFNIHFYIVNLGRRLAPKEVIILGSALTIVGLVVISVLGFRKFKDSIAEESSKY